MAVHRGGRGFLEFPRGAAATALAADSTVGDEAGYGVVKDRNQEPLPRWVTRSIAR